jgi:hypothetical protein
MRERAVFRLGTGENVTTSGTSAASTAFPSQTYEIRVAVTEATYVRVGDGTPTAVAGDTLMHAGATEYFRVSPGQKIAGLQVSTGGIMNVTPLTY